MAVNEGRSIWSQLGSFFRDAYVKVQQPVVYILVVTTVVYGLIPHPKVQLTVWGLLLAIVLRVLFEIHKHTVPNRAAQDHFSDLANAHERLEVCITSAYKKDRRAHIQWMGMTMFNVWNTMEKIFDSLAAQKFRDVKFEVAMLDATWLDEHTINRGWTGRSADEVASKILLYMQINADKLDGLNWTFRVRRYNHMPTLHGGIVNSETVFLGLARWEGETLKAGDRPFDVYAARDDEQSRDRVEVFKNWFDHCFVGRPDWTMRHTGGS